MNAKIKTDKTPNFAGFNNYTSSRETGRVTITSKNVPEAIRAAVGARAHGDDNIQAILEFCIEQSIKGGNIDPATRLINAMMQTQNAKGGVGFSQSEVNHAVEFLVEFGYFQLCASEDAKGAPTVELGYANPLDTGVSKRVLPMREYPSWKAKIERAKVKAPLNAYEMLNAVLAKYTRNDGAKNKAEVFGFSDEVVAQLRSALTKAEIATTADLIRAHAAKAA
jgi:hypothetical protein